MLIACMVPESGLFLNYVHEVYIPNLQPACFHEPKCKPIFLPMSIPGHNGAYD